MVAIKIFWFVLCIVKGQQTNSAQYQIFIIYTNSLLFINYRIRHLVLSSTKLPKKKTFKHQSASNADTWHLEYCYCHILLRNVLFLRNNFVFTNLMKNWINSWWNEIGRKKLNTSKHLKWPSHKRFRMTVSSLFRFMGFAYQCSRLTDNTEWQNISDKLCNDSKCLKRSEYVLRNCLRFSINSYQLY